MKWIWRHPFARVAAMYLIASAIAAIWSNARGAEPRLSAAPDVWTIGRGEWIDVDGIQSPQFDRAKMLVYPPASDVELRVFYTRDGGDYRPVLWARVNAENALHCYWLLIVYPDGDGVGHLSYAIRTGKAPNPPPTPGPGPDPTARGTVSIIVPRVAEDLTSDQAETLLNLRTWVDTQDESKVQMFVLEGDSDWGRKSESLPRVFIVQQADDGSSVVRWEGVLGSESFLREEVAKWTK
jgi:hypothetical protein